VNPNKVFLVQKGEIEGRVDPDMILYKQQILGFSFSIKLLKQLLKAKPQYGSNQAGIDRTSVEQARYIRITDIDEYGLLKNGLGVTAEFVEERYLLNNNDILFARSGATVGKSYLHKISLFDYKCFYAGYMIRFLVNENLLLPEFLFCYTQLEVYKIWTKAIQRVAGQPNINAEEYKSLPIPVPPLEIQAQIVAKFEAAYAQKRAKEAEAKTLLAGIDEYLLNALGIRLPEPAEKKKFFYVRASQVSGGRLDAPFYSHKLSLETLKFDMVRLSDHVLINPKTSFPVNLKVSFVPMEAVNRNGYMETLQDETSNNSKGYTSFKEKDLIWAKITPCMENGKSAIAQNLLNGLGFGSTEFHVFRVNSPKILIDYLFELFRTKHFREIARKQFGGSSGHQRVPPSFFKNLLIPFPPLAVQTEIAEHIRMIRAQAKQLKQEAKEIIERAKQEVEAMILGS